MEGSVEGSVEGVWKGVWKESVCSLCVHNSYIYVTLSSLSPSSVPVVDL